MNCNKEAVCFGHSRHKGEDAVKDTPPEKNVNTVITDCEPIFLKQGTRHRICLQHILRDAGDSVENDHGKTWSAKLYDFSRRLFRGREKFGPEGPEEAYKKAVRKEPDDILAPGEKYACEPPRPSYTKRQTLLRGLQKLKDHSLSTWRIRKLR